MLVKNKKTIKKLKEETVKDKKPLKAKKTPNQAVKIEVQKSDYLSHYVSPHLIDLTEFAPKAKADFWPVEEIPDVYFETEKAPLAPSFSQVDIKEAGANKQEDFLVKEQEIVDLYDEVEPFIPIEAGEDELEEFKTEVFEEELRDFSLPKLKPARRAIRFIKFKKIILAPFTLTGRGVIYLRDGLVELTEPLQKLSIPAPVKSVFAFVLVATLLVLPISGISYYKGLKTRASGIFSSVQAAIGNLNQAGGAVSGNDLAAANNSFFAAYHNFSAAEEELDGINKLVATVASLIPETDKTLDTAKAILQMGQDLSALGSKLTVDIGALEGEASLGEKVEKLKSNLQDSQPLIKEIIDLSSRIDVGQLPAEYQSSFLAIKSRLPVISRSFDNFIKIADLASDILGRKELKRYLIVFQNNSELRPTGGFIGSYALVDLVDGQIKNLEIPGGGSYDLQGSLKAKVAPPRPLSLINPRWEFQDSNWFPDWPTAAEKIIWFYNQAGQPTVDGVIAINANLMEDLLNIVGSVDVSGETVAADNFLETTQKQVELEYDKEKNQPKEFIARMAPEVLGKVFTADREQLLKIISLLNKSLVNKDLQLYFTKAEIEEKLVSLGWANQIKETDGDYLALVNTNINGEKTDYVIKQDILHQAKILDDGLVIDKVTIIRDHQGTAGEQFYGVPNVNYLRLYVPEGSRLLSASGFKEVPAEFFKKSSEEYAQDNDLLKISGLTRTDAETGVRINQEFGKTVFAGWTQTEPGEKTSVVLEYELPFKILFAKYKTDWGWLNQLEEKFNLAESTATYSLLTQKQSGAASDFYSFVELPASWQAVWQYPENLQVSTGNIVYSGQLNSDKIYSVIFKR